MLNILKISLCTEKNNLNNNKVCHVSTVNILCLGNNKIIKNVKR